MVEVEALISKGAVERCLPSRDQFISSYFLLPKADGTRRFILNLKSLNKFLVTSHFKMEDSRTVKKLIFKDCFLATIDLKDAYYLIPIFKHHRRFLRFKVGKNLYQFKCLPFGLSIAPFIFTKLLRPVLRYFRERNVTLIAYLDDFCVISDSQISCQNDVRFVLDTLGSLGFIINKEKSCLSPSRRCKFLGFIYDSNKLTIELTKEKREKIFDLIVKMQGVKQCKIKFFAHFIGLIVSACPAVKYGRLYTKKFEREKFLALKKSRQDYNSKMVIRDAINEDLIWWKSCILITVNNIKQDKYVLEIFSDASKTGWGVVCGDNDTHGWWSLEDSKEHINYLELKAAYYGLKCFANNIKSDSILLRIDNTTAISYINRMGSVQKPKLNNLAREIWKWGEQRDIWLYAAYIQSDRNKADMGSRVKSEETEWELSDYAFKQIKIVLGTPDVDLFASEANHKCTKYVSWMKDPYSIAVDAFTVPWNGVFFYAFPPFSLILRTLKKISFEGAEGIVVVPNWPSQPWYPLFKKLLKNKPILFNPSPGLLSSPFRNSHPFKNLSLVAGRLCGQRSE